MNQTTIEKKEPAKLVVTRMFNAPQEQVWKAWTESSLLDQWWAPKPWQARTKTLDFKEGGRWLYAMVGPDGSESWCRVDFQQIDATQSFAVDTAFCDEAGNYTNEAPLMHWENRFTEVDGGTKVEVHITFASEADLETIVGMGFKEGFTAAHDNLEELLQKEVMAS